jgi:hypothetical protein
MSRYERTKDGATHLWVVEQRGASVFTREGKAGGKGRIHHQIHATEAEAIAAVERETGKRTAEGWTLTDEKATISSPFRSKKQAERAKRGGSSTGLGFDVSEILRRLSDNLASATASGALTLDRIVTIFGEASSQRCTWRLVALEYGSNEDGSRLDLQARFGQGSGRNPDAYDFDGYAIDIALKPTDRDDLEDEVVIDEFVEGMRLAPETLVARFRRALDDLDTFRALRTSSALSADVRRVDG